MHRNTFHTPRSTHDHARSCFHFGGHLHSANTVARRTRTFERVNISKRAAGGLLPTRPNRGTPGAAPLPVSVLHRRRAAARLLWPVRWLLWDRPSRPPRGPAAAGAPLSPAHRHGGRIFEGCLGKYPLARPPSSRRRALPRSPPRPLGSPRHPAPGPSSPPAPSTVRSPLRLSRSCARTRPPQRLRRAPP